MSRIVYNKLVRDGIPAIIEADNQTPVTRVLSDADYRRALLEKLVEEAKELLESDGDRGERADIAEVLKSIDETFNFTTADIEELRQKKADARGGFAERIFLEEAILHD